MFKKNNIFTIQACEKVQTVHILLSPNKLFGIVEPLKNKNVRLSCCLDNIIASRCEFFSTQKLIYIIRVKTVAFYLNVIATLCQLCKRICHC